MTVAVNGKVPIAVGVPEMVPPALNDKPGGSDPAEIDHVSGCVPPVAVKLVGGYPTFTVPVGRAVWLTVIAGGLTTIWNWPLAVRCAASVTVAVNENVPVDVGVPVITPAGLKLNPGGSAPEVMDQVYGVVPPVAFRAVDG